MQLRIKQTVSRYPLELLFVISGAATLTSLILSNVLNYPPCDLCWYQRIFMFPLPLIYGAGLVYKDKAALTYGLPLIISGAAVGLYHNLLQWGIVSENLIECSYVSVSCADPIINWFGFLTIPLGSLSVFITLALLTWWVRKSNSKDRLATDVQAARRLLKLAGGLLVAMVLAVLIINGFVDKAA